VHNRTLSSRTAKLYSLPASPMKPFTCF